MIKLDKNLTKIDTNKSGICHHMMFETKYIIEIFKKIEKNHKDTFFNIFLKMVENRKGSGASEFEIYFNYMLKNHCDKIKIRQLKWKNDNDKNMDSIIDFDYVSYHWYLR